jgi:6-phosphogluconate dehydrogenase
MAVGRDKINGMAEQGYLQCGPNGAGDVVKMVHNGIEYGVMAAYAEGLSILRSANVGKQGNRAADAETTPLRDPEHRGGGMPFCRKKVSGRE